MRGFRLRAAALPCGASHFVLVVARGILDGRIFFGMIFFLDFFFLYRKWRLFFKSLLEAFTRTHVVRMSS
jgi:hypothetical protein